MSTDVLIKILKEFGYPVAVSLYLLYYNSKQADFFGKRLDDIKDILVDMSTQISYMLSANINYKAGNTEIGDMMSKQAIYQAEKHSKKTVKPKTKKVGEGE